MVPSTFDGRSECCRASLTGLRAPLHACAAAASPAARAARAASTIVWGRISTSSGVSGRHPACATGVAIPFQSCAVGVEHLDGAPPGAVLLPLVDEQVLAVVD